MPYGREITGVCTGRAVLTIVIEDGQPEVTTCLQRDSASAGGDDLWLFTQSEYVSTFYPGVRRMKEGERVRIYVRFYLEYSRDYWGEHDVEGHIAYIRTLRKHKAGKYYWSKADRARWGIK